MTEKTIDHHLITLAAFRYSLGRETYIVQEMIYWLKDKWSEIPGKTKGLIIREIEVALEIGAILNEGDANDWQEFLDFACEKARF